MERKAQNYSLEYKKWSFKIDETNNGLYFVNIKYGNSSGIYLNTKTSSIEEAKKRVENFIETELK